MKINHYRDSNNQLKDIEFIVSLVLQIGVAVSAIVILLGLVLLFTQLSPSATSYKQFTTTSFSFPDNFSELTHSIQDSRGIGFIVLGILLLILTPIVRVATSIVLFLHQKDIPMTIVTMFVLIILLGSFFVGMVMR